jgi:hypothetical protein
MLLARVLHCMSGMKTTIKVKTVEGEKKVKAVVRSVFAAHKTIGAKGYTVSHIPSGMCLMQNLNDTKHAETVAEMFSEIVGFDSLIAKLVANPRDRRTIKAIQNHTRGLRDRALVIASKAG